jgi:hypothetical protein
MKSPMNMAPNKMVSPAKKMDPMYNGKAGVQQEDFKQFSAAKMNSPAKMGSAYKMDKSAFKLKSAPVNMNTPGSVAKLAGVSPMKDNQAKADRLNSMAEKYSGDRSFRAAQTKYNQAALNDKTSGKVKKNEKK